MYHDAYCSECEEKIGLEIDGIITHSKSNNVSVKIVLGCKCTTIEPSATSLTNIEIGSKLPNEWKSETEPDKFDNITEYNK